jgi:hypothetical protein
MERLMARSIDVDKVQEALDRAARNAVYGPRDVKAGRFVASDASVSLPQRKPKLARSRSSAESNGAEKRKGAARK